MLINISSYNIKVIKHTNKIIFLNISAFLLKLDKLSLNGTFRSRVVKYFEFITIR